MAEVNWYKDKVKLVLDKHVQQSIEAIAFRIEERTKVNISEAPGASGQGLIDTGFMINSTYTVLPDGSSYGDADQSGFYQNREGLEVERNLAPERPLPRGAGALVAVGAEYAIYQEMEHGFFIQAIEDTAKEIGGLVKTF
jgi:hypothetical protein